MGGAQRDQWDEEKLFANLHLLNGNPGFRQQVKGRNVMASHAMHKGAMF